MLSRELGTNDFFLYNVGIHFGVLKSFIGTVLELRRILLDGCLVRIFAEISKRHFRGASGDERNL